MRKTPRFQAFFEIQLCRFYAYESPALTAELPDRRVAVGWCDVSDAADSELSIVAEGWSVGRAGVPRSNASAEQEVTASASVPGSGYI